MFTRLLTGSSVVFLLVVASRAQLPNPRLDQVFPAGGQIGQTLIVTVAGRDLDDANRLLFSHPGIVGSVQRIPHGESQSESPAAVNQFEVEIPANIAPGRYDVRVVGRFGASTPRTFEVSDFAEITESIPHQEPAQALPLPVDTVVNGRMEAGSVDYYLFSAGKGQCYVVECLAGQIDSPLQPILTIWQKDGTQQLRSQHPSERVLVFEAPKDAPYMLGVQDHVFGGGANYIYRLRIRSGPYLVTSMPSAGPATVTSLFTLFGFNLPRGEPSILRRVNVSLQQQQVRIYLPDATHEAVRRCFGPKQSYGLAGYPLQLTDGEHRSNALRLGLTRHPVIVEQAVNDLPGQAETVSLPCEFAGRFYPRTDQDWIAFPAQKGQTFQLRVLSHRLGVTTDPEIYVQQVVTAADGQARVTQVSMQDDLDFDASRFRQRVPRAFDLTHRDPDVRFTADEDGVYRVGLRDLYGGARDDPRLVYRLIVSPARPDFQLLAWTQRQAVDNDRKIEAASPVLRRGGHLTINVDVIRSGGLTGPVELGAERLPPGVSAFPSVVHETSSQGVLVLMATEDAAAWVGPIHVVGQAQIDGQTIRRTAWSGTLLADTADVQNRRPDGRLTSDLILSIPEGNLAPVAIRFGEGEMLTTSMGGSLDIPVTRVPRGEIKEDLTLTPIGLGQDSKPPDVTLKADVNQARLQWALSDNKIPLGRHTFYLRGKVKLSYSRDPQTIDPKDTVVYVDSTPVTVEIVKANSP